MMNKIKYIFYFGVFVVIGCGGGAESQKKNTNRHLTIFFHTFNNIKSTPTDNLYPKDLGKIATPLTQVECNDKVSDCIFDWIKFKDFVNNQNISIDLETLANGNVMMDNTNGVEDQVNAFFDETEIDKILLKAPDTSYHFAIDDYLTSNSTAPNFFIFNSTQKTLGNNLKSYTSEQDLRGAISKFLATNDTLTTIVVAYNPPFEKKVEPPKPATTTLPAKPSNKTKLPKVSNVKATEPVQKTGTTKDCGNITAPLISIKNNHALWGHVSNADKYLVLVSADYLDGKKYTEATNLLDFDIQRAGPKIVRDLKIDVTKIGNVSFYISVLGKCKESDGASSNVLHFDMNSDYNVECNSK